MAEYTEQADKFLKDSSLEFRAVLVGSDCPAFCDDAKTDRDMDKVNVFPRKSHIHGKHYRCTISRKARGHVSFDFWNSYRDEECNAFNFGQVRNTCGHGPDCLCQTRAGCDGILLVCRENAYWDKYRKHSRQLKQVPSAYDLLACLTKYDPDTFENFCSEYGYDTDSRRAEQIYHSVQKEWEKVFRFFTAEELAALQEIS